MNSRAKSLLRSVLSIASHLFWSSLTLVLVLLALLVSLGRYYMPQLGQHQAEILAEIRKHVPLEFELEGLEGEWRGLSPVLRVKQFRLYNPDGEVVVQAEHLAVYVDLVESLYRRTPLAQTVSLVNADIELDQASDGRWGLKGLVLGKGSPRVSAAVTAFLEQIDLLELTHVSLTALLPEQRQYRIDSLSLVLRHGMDLSQLTLELAEAGGGRVLRLAAEFEGWLDNPQSLRGYLSLDQLDLALVEPFLADWYRKLPPTLSGEIWLDWKAGEAWQALGTLITADWDLQALAEREVPTLAALDFDFKLDVQPSGAVSGRVQDLGFSWSDVEYRYPELSFGLDAQRRDLELAIRSINIQPLVEGSLNSTLLPEGLAQVFETTRPRGKLRNVHVDIPLQEERREAFRVRANIADAALESWKGAPGASSIDGYVEAGLDYGEVDLDGSSMTLAFPGLFEQPLSFAGLDAQVGWTIGERIEVHSGLIRLHGDFGTGRGQLDLEIPKQKAEGDYGVMSLLIGLQNTDARYRNRFIPKILSPELLSWLDVSIEAARIDQVGYIYYGALASAEPLDQTSQLFLDARDGQVKYQPDWPKLEQIEAQVVLSDNYLFASAPRARTLNSKVSDVEVELIQRQGVSWLQVTGDLAGPGGDLIRVLNETPLHDTTGGAFESWRAQGNYSAELDLGIPLQSTLKQSMRVAGQLQNLQFENPDLGLVFKDVNGALSYSSDEGVSSRRLDATLWGKPLRIRVGAGLATAAGNEPLVLHARGDVAVAGLQKWLDNPALGLARGSSQMRAEMVIVPAGDTTAESKLSIQSDLQGVELAVPAPFGKTAADLRELELTLSLRDVGYSEFHYHGLAAGRVQLSGESPRAGITLGSQMLPPLPESGIVVTGNLPEAALDPWLDTIERFSALVGEESTAPQAGLALQQIRIDSLSAFGETLERPLIDIGVHEGRWQIALEHPRIQGKVAIPREGEAFGIDLEYLHMPLNDSVNAPAVGEGLASVDPAQLPAINFKVGEFSVEDLGLGRWQLASRPEPKGARISGLTIDIAGAIFGGIDISEGATLDWSYDGHKHHSVVDGMLRAGNLDDLFNHWGYETGVVSESAEIITSLQWQGAPDAIGLRVVKGDLNLTVRDGQLQQTSGTAADALKVISVLNINNLARRLRLDFSDLYKKGMSYDKIQGILLFDEGTMSMVEPLVVDGPGSNMKMTGDFNFSSGNIDAQMVVALPITSNLPWVVALTLPGGIPLAAGVYVAGKVFEKQLQKLTSAVYSVTGTLDDPTISFKRLSEPSKKSATNQSSSSTEGSSRRSSASSRK